MHVQVIAPEEIIDPSVDEQSVMTYLSQFPKAKLKAGAPLKPKLNPKKARAYGPGRPQRRGGRPGRATWENTPRAPLRLAVEQLLRCCDNRRKGTAVETKETAPASMSSGPARACGCSSPWGFRCWFRCSGLNREIVQNKAKPNHFFVESDLSSDSSSADMEIDHESSQFIVERRMVAVVRLRSCPPC